METNICLLLRSLVPESSSFHLNLDRLTPKVFTGIYSRPLLALSTQTLFRKCWKITVIRNTTHLWKRLTEWEEKKSSCNVSKICKTNIRLPISRDNISFSQSSPVKFLLWEFISISERVFELQQTPCFQILSKRSASKVNFYCLESRVKQRLKRAVATLLLQYFFYFAQVHLSFRSEIWSLFHDN